MSRVDELQGRIASLGSCVVAFSGGVDSSLVAALAARALGARALAITACSAAVATEERDAAGRVATAIGIAHETIATNELARDDYARNDRFRCYHCKTELYGRLSILADRRGYATLLSGANADDSGDWRPGLRAAREHGVIHPLLESGVGKAEVRQLARMLGVPSADKPASPCLASRIPYGRRVSAEALSQIEQAERALKRLGYRVLRVRHYGGLARVEFGGDELTRALSSEGRAAVVSAVQTGGYEQVRIDPKPFRSGSLNDISPIDSPRVDPAARPVAAKPE
jgi:pyridinium-3,5-biscarboxylic acid mononucleotide sulfurtransferase